MPSSEPGTRPVGWRASRRVWGALCGAAFITIRASIYLIVLPLAALVCLAGVALYALQGVKGHHA
jgi:hypothetical protein